MTGMQRLSRLLEAKSYSFKDFDDPWKSMSPEDRTEANRLFKAAMKAFPASPRQKELQDKLSVILAKYGIGKNENRIQRLSRLLEAKNIIAYHGSSVPIKRFSKEFAAQGIFWFSEDRDRILKGDAGAAGRDYIIKVSLSVNKTAGWAEYEKYLLAQLRNDKYDSIHLDDDWAIFDPKNIRILGIEK